MESGNENSDGPNLSRSARRHGQENWFLARGVRRPLLRIQGRRVEVTLASPKGGQAPIDPRSDDPNNQTAAMAQFKNDPATQKVLANTARLAAVTAEDFDTVFIRVVMAQCGTWWTTRPPLH